MRNGTQPGARTSASPMSALGQKQTFAVQSAMSAYPESGHVRCTILCPLSANSGHRAWGRLKMK